LKKLNDYNRKAIFVGYELGCKAYRCYDPADKCVVISRDVTFDDATSWTWENTDAGHDEEPFTIEYSTEVVQAPVPAPGSPTPSPPPCAPLVPTSPPVGEPIAPEEGMAEVDAEDLDADHYDAPLCIRSINEVIRETTPPGLAHRVCTTGLNFTSAEDLSSFSEAEQDVAWCTTMQVEIKAIADNDT
jgi:hypothetical protein